MLLAVDDIHWADPSSLALRDLTSAVQRIPLGGLDWNSTHALVQGLWGLTPAPAAFVTEVHQRTNGDPFFVQEVTSLRLLQGERPGFAVSPGVGQVVGRRLARLSQAAHALLAVSSVTDDEVDPELLAL
jgi:predicted ATPase